LVTGPEDLAFEVESDSSDPPQPAHRKRAEISVTAPILDTCNARRRCLNA
jgi:hypothetical protein